MTLPELPPIVSIDWLRSDAARDVVVCDCRAYLDEREGIDAYNAGHIPGARFVDLDTVLAAPAAPVLGRHPLPTPEAFAAGMSAAGISHDAAVVAYDDAGGMIAGRLVWMLRIFGQSAALLDGGIQAWDGELEMTAPSVDAVAHDPRPWPTDAIVTAEDVERILEAGGLVVDSRGPDRYNGVHEPIDPIAGHVPGAINLPFAGNLVGGVFRPIEELKDRFAKEGVNADTVYYCGSGVSACNNMLAAEAAGFGRGRLYVGSWSGWATRAESR